MELLRRLLRRDRITGQAARFITVGFLNTAVDLGVFYLLMLIPDMNDVVAKAVSYFLGICNSFLWNKYWTFRDGGQPASIGQYSVFLLASLGGLLINTVLLYLIVEFFSPAAWHGSMLWMNVAKLMATAGHPAWNFCFYRWVVFRLQPGTLT